jgi:hypothetical protein
LRLRHVLVFCTTAFCLAACGSNGPVTSAPPLPTATPAQSATASALIPTTGGAVTVSIAGISVVVTAPAGAFAAASTLTVTLGLPSSSTIGTFAKKRTRESVPSGASALASLTISTGGATLLAPLTAVFSGVAAPAAGTSALLSGYNGSAYDDVATMIYAGGSYSETTDPHYPGITLGAPTNYVLYTVASGNVATPSAAITLTGPAAPGAGTPTTYAAAETTANGIPFLGHTFSYGATPASVGTIGASTGVFTGGGVGGSGTLSAADAAVAAYTGTLAITVSSARPGYAGFAQTFGGTLTEIDTNYAISTTPIATTIASTVASSVATTNDTSGNSVFTAKETDTSNTATTTSTTTSTVAYQAGSGGATNVRALSTVASESTGVIYEHDYGATNGLLTVIPETTGTFTNDATEEYKETDPGIGITTSGTQGVTTDQVIAPSGAYSSTTVEPNLSTGVPTTDTATENVDFSGVLALNSIDPGNYQITYGAPAGGNIVVTLLDPNSGLNDPNTIPSWIPAVNTQPSVESDTITAGAALDSNCTVSSSLYTGPVNEVLQTKDVVDSVQGTYEHRVTETFDANGAGTICSVVSDTIQTFYDYSGQEGEYIIAFIGSATQPVLTTTITEALSLQPASGTAGAASSGRTTQAVAARPLLPVTLLTAHVEHIAHLRAATRMAAFVKHQSLKLRGGSVK